ncbi:MAG TPA: aspartate kinase [Thermomicrobiales bacterium]|nr:aspartate kinase [Thermomicrobiales bacterium]
MLVMKFGGTSVGSATAIANTADILAQYAANDRVVAIVSAMSGITNTLLAKAAAAAAGDSEGVDAARVALLAPHRAVLLDLLPSGDRRRETEAELVALADEASRLLYSVYVLRELSPRASDRIVSFGERMSSVLVAAVLNERGTPALAVAADRLIVTDGVFGSASPLLDRTRQKAGETLAPVFAAGLLPVVTGFFGADERGITTTLGRGGSDYSAAILGNALDADEIWIWTDVDGVMTADPRIIPEAHTLAKITYAEATELAYFGAKVIHPKTMHPAVERDIPIWIKNSFNPAAPGTMIGPEAANGSLAKAITSISGLAAITVEGRGQIGVTDVTARTFTALARISANVYMISQASSQHSVTFVVSGDQIDQTLAALETEFEIDLSRGRVLSIASVRDLAIVAAVGGGMRGTPGVAGRVFTAMGNEQINIVAIAQGSSELNITFVIAAEEVGRAVSVLHQVFMLE